jgi:predicted phage terminase large subunit-like protein
MVRESWFQRYDPQALPTSFDQVIQSWDTANKPTELADDSVCTTWGLKGPHFYLLNVLRKKLKYPDLERAVHEESRLFNSSVILIEDKASGTQLIQSLIEAGLSKVTRYTPDGDKIMRLHAQTATIERFRASAPRSPLAGRIPARADGILQWPSRRPDRLNFPNACLGKATAAGLGHS